jgi:hypothetical protein
MKETGDLEGFKWFGDNNEVLVAAGSIDLDWLRNDPYRVLSKLTLNHNQRLVGVKSSSSEWENAQH